MGLDDIKRVVGFGLTVGETLIQVGGLPSPLAKAAAMIRILEDVPQLFGVDYSTLLEKVKALTPEELDELNVYIDTNFSIPDADKEAKIEAAISVVIDVVKVVEKAIAMWTATPAAA